MIVVFFGVIILLWIMGIIYLVKRQEELDEEEELAEDFRLLIRKKFDNKGEKE